jgi:seryl-tRNA synthetase
VAARTIIGFTAAAVVAAGVCLWQDVKSKREEIKAERALLSSAKSKYEGVVSKVNAARASLVALEHKFDESDRLTEEKKTLSGEIAELEPERDELRKKIAEVLQGVRLKYIGKSVPEIRLDSGVVLRNVKFQNITDSEISFSHDGGIARLSAGSLPAEFRDLFGIHTPTAAAVASSVPSQAPVAIAPAPVPTPAVVLTTIEQDRVSTDEAAIRIHQKTQAELQRTRNAYLAQADDYQKKDQRAKFLGKSPRYQKVIPKIVQAINQLDTQLAEISTRIATLQMQVDDIRQGTVKEPAGAPGSPH